MGRKPEEVVGEAVDRVIGRYRVTQVAVTSVSFAQFQRDVMTEVRVELDRLTARNLRKMHKANMRVWAVAERAMFIGQPPALASAAAERALAGFDPVKFAAALAEPAGVPPWHPEHPENDF